MPYIRTAIDRLASDTTIHPAISKVAASDLLPKHETHRPNLLYIQECFSYVHFLLPASRSLQHHCTSSRVDDFDHLRSIHANTYVPLSQRRSSCWCRTQLVLSQSRCRNSRQTTQTKSSASCRSGPPTSAPFELREASSFVCD